MPKPDEIRISNRATYWPVAPIDLVVGAPLVVRALLGVTPLGRVVQAAVLGAYLASAARDWHDRRGIRRIDFRREFSADLGHLVPMPREDREAEVRTLADRLNDEFVPQRRPRRELAVEVDRHLTRYIASITGQHVRTSTEVRGFALAKLAFPFALGACDALSSDIAILSSPKRLAMVALANSVVLVSAYVAAAALVWAVADATMDAPHDLETVGQRPDDAGELRLATGGLGDGRA